LQRSIFFCEEEGISLKFRTEYIPNYTKPLERKGTSKQEPKGSICNIRYLPAEFSGLHDAMLKPVSSISRWNHRGRRTHESHRKIQRPGTIASEALNTHRQLPLQDLREQDLPPPPAQRPTAGTRAPQK
jgi:hypothetical protein